MIFWILVLLPFGSLASSEELSLLRWQPDGYRFSFLVPRLASESPQQALAGLRTQLATTEGFQQFQGPFLGSGRFVEVNPSRVLAVGLAQASGRTDSDFHPNPKRMERLLGPLRSRGAETALLPAGFSLRLDEAQKRALYEAVGRTANVLIAPGGADVHPSLYGEEIRLARPENLLLDKEQRDLTRHYFDHSKGFYFGVCRGAQMGAVALGCRMFQDIAAEVPGALVHHGQGFGSVTHDLEPRAGTPQGPSERLMARPEFRRTNRSIHHQAIRPTEESVRVRVTAVSPADGVPEVLEYLDPEKRVRGLGTQFHPELDSERVRNSVFDVVMAEARKAKARSKPALAIPIPCATTFSQL